MKYLFSFNLCISGIYWSMILYNAHCAICTCSHSLLFTFLTGRGFVMDRSPHSDYVFAKAMVDTGLMSQEGESYHSNYLLPLL